MKTLCIVMAHAGTEETCRRHMPYWQASASVVAFFCPSDSVMILPDALYIPTFGHRSHHDRMANERFRHVITEAATQPYDRVIIHEYDSICLGGIPDTPPVAVAGLMFKAAKERGFLGSTFIHPPLIIWKPVMQQLACILEQENMNGESGFWDRLLGHVCDKNSIPLWNLRDCGLGYSQNTIQPHHYPEVVAAVNAGAKLFHGIKTEEALKVINDASNSRRRPRILAC